MVGSWVMGDTGSGGLCEWGLGVGGTMGGGYDRDSETRCLRWGEGERVKDDDDVVVVVVFFLRASLSGYGGGKGGVE